MQPIGIAWNKLPRLVRDLSHDMGKKIELTMLGAETELDRQVLALIKDPLTHMVRNSGDHGLETPAERRAAGKPETGTIVLDARPNQGRRVLTLVPDYHLCVVFARQVMETVSESLRQPAVAASALITTISGPSATADIEMTRIKGVHGPRTLDVVLVD